MIRKVAFWFFNIKRHNYALASLVIQASPAGGCTPGVQGACILSLANVRDLNTLTNLLPSQHFHQVQALLLWRRGADLTWHHCATAGHNCSEPAAEATGAHWAAYTAALQPLRGPTVCALWDKAEEPTSHSVITFPFGHYVTPRLLGPTALQTFTGKILGWPKFVCFFLHYGSGSA